MKEWQTTSAPGRARYALPMGYLFGAVCPDRGWGAGLVMSYANTEAMNKHLDEIGKAVAPGRPRRAYPRWRGLA